MSIEFYNKNAEEFYNGTVNADMSATCDKFLQYIKPGGQILDAGCGSGRDSLYFLNRGYKVVSMDASEKMVEVSSLLTGQKTLLMKFEEIDFQNQFDGVWACASLLHVPKSNIVDVLKKLVISLREKGVFFASFKYGNNEIIRDERLFNSYDEDSLKDLMKSVPELECIDIWITQDVRPGREGEPWVSCIYRKTKRGICYGTKY